MEKNSSFKKEPKKNLRVLDPIKRSPFVVPTTARKEAPTGNAPVGVSPLQAVNNRFPQVGGNQTTEAPDVVCDLTLGDEGVEPPPPNDSSKASLSPPVGGCLRSYNGLNIITNGYFLPFISKPKLARASPIQSEYKAHQKDLALATCIQSLCSKNAIERVENVKSLRFYSQLFLVPKPHQRWRPVIDLSRLNTLLVERFNNGNSRVHQGLSDSRGLGVVDRPIRSLPSHPHPPKLKEVPKVLPQVTGALVHLPSFQPSHGPTGLYNDCKGSEADGPDKGNQTSPIPG